MAEGPFQNAFNEFMAKVERYSASQRKQILQQTISALNNILVSFPAPRAEAADEEERSRSQSITDPRLKKQLSDIELIIGEKMHQVGATRSMFTRFDLANQGSLSEKEFRAAIAKGVGVGLSDVELQLLVQKYDTRGDGRICYDDYLSYVNARRKAELRTSAQDSFSAALASRPHLQEHEIDRILAEVEVPLTVKLSNGLKALRDTLYSKNKSLSQLYKQCQNDKKQVLVDELVPKLESLGFPKDACSQEDLHNLVGEYSVEHPGVLSYKEFLNFFSGNAAPSGTDQKVAMQLDQPALLAILVKINNQSLRKFFKELDTDNDGMITTAQLCQGLEEAGLTTAVTRHPDFAAFAETFCKRKSGHFGYAEFIQFVNQRKGGAGVALAGQPVFASTPTEIPEDSTPSQTLDTLHEKCKGVSVESVFLQFDAEGDKKVNESDFYQALGQLGFIISPTCSKALFDAFQPQNGYISYGEFARAVSNPNTNYKLSTKVRHSPGGESTVPLGSYSDSTAPPPTPDRFSRNFIRPPGGLSSIEFGASAVEQQPSGWTPKANVSTLSLGSDVKESDLPARPAPRAQPPGGHSSVNFAGDHGASPRTATRGSPGGSSSVTLSFDPNHDIDSVKLGKRISSPPSTKIAFQPEDISEEPVRRPLTAALQAPGGTSSVSFNQNDREEHRPLIRQLASPGGNTSLDLTFDPAKNAPPAVTRPTTAPGGVTSVDLSFDPKSVETTPVKKVAAKQAPGGDSTFSLAHSHHSEVSTPRRTVHASVQSPGGNPSMRHLGNDEHTSVLAQFNRAADSGMDWDLLAKISDLVYNRGRLRHTFQELIAKPSVSTLSKKSFQEGMAKFGMAISDQQLDGIYAMFDDDGDEELTYAEFVRMLATKKSEP